MPLLTKEQILATAKDVDTRDIQVPEWGDGTLRIKQLTLGERQAYENYSIRASKQNNGLPNVVQLRERLIAMCLVGDDGNRLFTDKEIGQLSDVNAAVADRVFDECRAFNGLGTESLEDEAGNLGAALSGSSSTS